MEPETSNPLLQAYHRGQISQEGRAGLGFGGLESDSDPLTHKSLPPGSFRS